MTSPITANGRMGSREMARLRRRYAVRHVLARLGLYTAAALAALACAAPLLWSLITSVKQSRDLADRTKNPLLFSRPATSDHVLFLFRDTPYLTFVVNTLIIGGAVVVVTLALALPAAYSLARLNRPWGARTGLLVGLVALVPPALLFLPLSRVVVMLGLDDTLWSMVLVYPTITVPVSVWLLIGFLKAVPRELEEQAMVDGHSRLGAFIRTVVPLILPGVVAVVVFGLTLTAGEFVYALTFVSTTSRMPVGTGLSTHLISGDVFYWQSLQAAVVTVAAPIALMFSLFLDRFTTGSVIGAVRT